MTITAPPRNRRQVAPFCLSIARVVHEAHGECERGDVEGRLDPLQKQSSRYEAERSRFMRMFNESLGKRGSGKTRCRRRDSNIMYEA